MFAMRRDGTVKDIWIRNSSGHDLLDAAAIDTIRKAQPAPRIPSELPDQLNVLIPVAFDLPQ
jgi:protein TonB